MSKKRERSVNFTKEESNVLATIIEGYQTVIETKKNDADTWNEKECCWKKVEREFNILNGTIYRNAKTLKLKYEGMKREVRKKSAAIRADMDRTGGESNGVSDFTPAEEKVRRILLSASKLDSTYDSDSVDPELVQQPEIESFHCFQSFNSFDSDKKETIIIKTEEPTTDLSIETPLENPIQPHQINESQPQTPTKKWQQWKPTNLKTKNHPALSISKRKKVFVILAKEKLDLVQKQKLLLDEEMKNKKKQWEFEEAERKWKLEMLHLERQNLYEDIENKKKLWEFEAAERRHKTEVWALEKEVLLKKIQREC